MKKMNELEITRLNLQLTKKCNQRCKSCNSYNLESSNELSTEEIKQGIRQTCELYDIKNIALTGGEPTIHKDILEIAKYAKKYSDMVSVTTNGFYFTDKNRVEELVCAGINRYSFSYHSIGGQDSFTGINGSEERVRKAIDWLIEVRKYSKNLYVKIGTLFNGRNIQNVEKILDYAESKDIDLYIEVWDNTNYLFTKKELATDFNIVEQTKDEIEKALDRIHQWKTTGRKVLIDDMGINFMRHWFLGLPIRGGCPLGYTDLYIESSGDVRTGCWFLESVGNIKESSIKDIISNSLYQKNIENMVNRNCNGCTCGYLMQAKYMESIE